MGGVLKFEAPRGVATVRVYEEPERVDDLGDGTEESESSFASRVDFWRVRQDVAIEVDRVDHETRGRWRFRRAAILAEDAKRLRDDPILEQYGATEEGLEAMAGINREILSGCLRRILGVQIGDEDLSLRQPATTPEDRASLINLLEEVDLLGFSGQAALRAQKPTPRQGES